ncbi:peptidase family M1-domain-containing protein [Polychytrium aggregatum]|uniref:peptidase family M1-domain-containing protein n=1 Tax=Polychytrium aggregatum TaxID=110093 RepID=UPI0022FEBC4F|nr:peptidase family M1-domain-containing protein [Polychytrium aggregatum]KAI9193142.1 peptidase family M1-domain-containing protein [Polychytrium aggregatum]
MKNPSDTSADADPQWDAGQVDPDDSEHGFLLALDMNGSSSTSPGQKPYRRHRTKPTPAEPGSSKSSSAWFSWSKLAFAAALVAVASLVIITAVSMGGSSQSERTTALPESLDFLQANSSQGLRLSSSVIPRHYDLEVTPDLETLGFHGTVDIALLITEPTYHIRFHALDLNLSNIYLAQGSTRLLPTRVVEDPPTQTFVLLFGTIVGVGDYRLSIDFDGVMGDGEPAGFYRSSYMDGSGQKHYLAITHFEPVFARMAFPCFDEPALKASFKITVCSALTALSNMPLNKTEPVGASGMSRYVFQKTPPQSTYLAAWGVSDYSRVEARTSSGIPVGVYAPSESINLTSFALDVATRSMEFFQKLYNYTLPVPKMDHFPVPDFTSEGMENWGLITYEDSLLLINRSSAPAQDLQASAMLIAHEIAHQWFGDLVTMAWWDDLWLNEGFAEFMQYKSVAALHPDWDLLSQFFVYEHLLAFEADESMFTHPIYLPVADPLLLPMLFDDVTYNKGASVIRMLEDWLESADGGHLSCGQFCRGLRQYLVQYAESTAQTANLWHALDAVGPEAHKGIVNDTMSGWISNPGFPVVLVSAQNGFVRLTQFRYTLWKDTNATEISSSWQIPVSYRILMDPHSSPTHATPAKTVLMNGHTTIMTPAPRNSLVLINRDRVGFYRVMFDSIDYYKQLSHWLKSSPSLFSPADRAGFLSDIWALATSNRLGLQLAMDITTFVAKDRDPTVWRTCISVFKQMDRLVGAHPFIEAWNQYKSSLVGPVAAEIGWGAFAATKSRSGSKPIPAHALSLLRSALIPYAITLGIPRVVSTGLELFDELLTGNLHDAPDEILPWIYSTAVMHSSNLTEAYYILWHLRESLPGDTVSPLAQTPLQALQNQTIKIIESGELRPQMIVPMLSSLAGAKHGASVVWSFFLSHADQFLSVSSNSASQAVEKCVSLLESAQQIRQAQDLVGGPDGWMDAEPGESGSRTGIRRGLERLVHSSKFKSVVLKGFKAHPE